MHYISQIINRKCVTKTVLAFRWVHIVILLFCLPRFEREFAIPTFDVIINGNSTLEYQIIFKMNDSALFTLVAILLSLSFWVRMCVLMYRFITSILLLKFLSGASLIHVCVNLIRNMPMKSIPP